jgi:hypothetical protein
MSAAGLGTHVDYGRNATVDPVRMSTGGADGGTGTIIVLTAVSGVQCDARPRDAEVRADRGLLHLQPGRRAGHLPGRLRLPHPAALVGFGSPGADRPPWASTSPGPSAKGAVSGSALISPLLLLREPGVASSVRADVAFVLCSRSGSTGPDPRRASHLRAQRAVDANSSMRRFSLYQGEIISMIDWGP